MGDAQLRTRLAEILDEAGVRHDMALADDGPAIVVLDDAVRESSEKAPIIRLWRMRRQCRVEPTDPSPFDDSRVVGWIGTTPELDQEGLRGALNHLTTRRFVTLASVLSPDAHILDAAETSSLAKRDHRRRMQEFFAAAQPGSAVMDSLELAFEELYANAAYNAPTDAQGNHLFSSTSRATPVTSPRPFHVRFGYDSQYVAISVCDAYGSLKPERLIACFKRCFAPGGAVVEDKEGGAGVGFYMLLQSATRLIVNIKAGQFTEVIFVRKLGQRRREFAASAPTLSVCVVDGEEARRTSRRYPRRRVEWTARVRKSLFSRANVLVLDVSEGGAFVCPLVSADLAVREGDTLAIQLVPKSGARPVKVRACVRWVGKSAEHNCRGFGVAFESPIDLSTFRVAG